MPPKLYSMYSDDDATEDISMQRISEVSNSLKIKNRRLEPLKMRARSQNIVCVV